MISYLMCLANVALFSVMAWSSREDRPAFYFHLTSVQIWAATSAIILPGIFK